MIKMLLLIFLKKSLLEKYYHPLQTQLIDIIINLNSQKTLHKKLLRSILIQYELSFVSYVANPISPHSKIQLQGVYPTHTLD